VYQVSKTTAGTMAFYAFYAPDFFRKYRAKKDMEKPIRTSDTATHI